MDESIKEDVRLFVQSLRRKKMPWADGCANLILALESRLAAAEEKLDRPTPECPECNTLAMSQDEREDYPLHEWIALARQLERQRDEAREENKRLLRELIHAYAAGGDAEIALQRERAAREAAEKGK